MISFRPTISKVHFYFLIMFVKDIILKKFMYYTKEFAPKQYTQPNAQITQ